METDREGLGLQIREEIDPRAVDGTQQAACIVMTPHLLTDDLDHGGFSPIGDHLDGVDEVLALGAEAIEARLLRQVLERDVAWGGLALSLERIDFVLQLRDTFLEVGLALRKGLDLARFDLAFQVDSAELGDLPAENADLFFALVRRACGGPG